MKSKMFFAGSGGQGTLAIGQMIAKAAMDEGKEVTWLPSYGPEMRGGTANCTVVVSDKPIACPLINDADLLVVMNLPSLLKFESMVTPGGLLIINSSMVPEKATRDDIRVVYVPANDKAIELGNDKAANMVMLGAILKETGIVEPETIREQMRHMFSGRKEKFLPMNLAALDMYLT
ncbi:MAG: 2-oxoacid:ferredoxin oxidoreductase subunit gamma [Ruminococcaceae bacterium]|nr:2-oxoacid:ferredoxin oxidoreductase subunit gamma [Oscillospiraceae bacterium]